VAFLYRYYGASRSGFYAWQRRGEPCRVKADRELSARIRRVHQDSRGTYGSPRVYQALKRQGVRVAEKRVARLMREARLRASDPESKAPARATIASSPRRPTRRINRHRHGSISRAGDLKLPAGLRTWRKHLR
jgi:hypothetical protein